MGMDELMSFLGEKPHINGDAKLKKFVLALSRYCDFSDAWKDRTPCGHSAREMGYTRSDFSGRKWWTSPFPLNRELETPERAKELDDVTSMLMEAFPSLNALGDFCELFAEDLRRDNEYNLYYKGRYASYWIRVIIRKRDYNLYVHSIVPNGKGCAYEL